jgi:hypothetical protein
MAASFVSLIMHARMRISALLPVSIVLLTMLALVLTSGNGQSLVLTLMQLSALQQLPANAAVEMDARKEQAEFFFSINAPALLP